MSRAAGALFALFFALPAAALEEAQLLAALRVPGHVLMLRHAYAPGVGDPDNFAIGECATQRNLDERGRRDARAIGQRLRAAGIAEALVLSSVWCRCTETAALLGVGEVKTAPALNSFFSRPEKRPQGLAAARRLIQEISLSEKPVVMVTHDVVIRGLTGRSLSSGEGVVLRSHAGALQVLGTLDLGKFY